MRTITFYFRTLAILLITVLFTSCQKDNTVTTDELQTVAESRLRFSQPTCTSVLGTGWDKEIILNGPEYLQKALLNEGVSDAIFLTGPVDSRSWTLESKCADAYVSFTPEGEIYAEAHGYDNYTSESFSMKLISSPKGGTMVSISGKSEKEWKVVSTDATTYKNRVVIIATSDRGKGSNRDIAMVTLNIHTKFEEINGYRTAKASLSLLGFSFL
ncbi:MAG: hypothetical protein IPM42_16330 [Saprospiraceae bacterium]|nr:hypothetical protein [Saprospiraceae bacterium]